MAVHDVGTVVVTGGASGLGAAVAHAVASAGGTPLVIDRQPPNGGFEYELADLANSFSVVQSMRVVPFSKETVMQLAIVTAAPLLPLLLTMISAEELIKRLLSAVF